MLPSDGDFFESGEMEGVLIGSGIGWEGVEGVIIGLETMKSAYVPEVAVGFGGNLTVGVSLQEGISVSVVVVDKSGVRWRLRSSILSMSDPKRAEEEEDEEDGTDEVEDGGEEASDAAWLW